MPLIPLAPRFEVHLDSTEPSTALGRMYPLDAFDRDALMWLLPTLGPAATLIYGSLVTADGNYIMLDELGWQHGLPASRAHKAIDRLARFQCVTIIEAGAAVHPRRWAPHLHDRKLNSAPPWWVAAHEISFPLPRSA